MAFLRPPLKWFADKMEDTLKANDWKGGWYGVGHDWLFKKLVDEVGELARDLYTMNHADNPDHFIKECTDVANIAMMLADITNQVKKNPEEY
jgi:NTP pyrophosphatase (non-canonical NTP hydrolase)